MSLADIYCLVCNKVDGQVEVEDDRGTMYIIHGNCNKGTFKPEERRGGTKQGCTRDSKGRFLPKSK